MSLTALLETVEIVETVAELDVLELETAAGYALQTDVRAGALACPSSTSYKKYKGVESCQPFTPCY